LQVLAWQQETAGGFELLWLEGAGHNYITDAPAELLAKLKERLLPGEL
jgi:surfactin synthase thioesterase subunit